jgi:hypothetical protein
MSETYENLDQKPYESHYLYFETTIDRPVEIVWPHALNIGSWMSAHRLETLAGEPGMVGHFERVYPHDWGGDAGLPHYHVYGVAHIVPFKYIALEVLPEKGGSYGNAREWMSFDGVLLVDLGGVTKVIFLLVDVHRGNGDKEYFDRTRKELESAGHELIGPYFENLRRLASGSA